MFIQIVHFEIWIENEIERRTYQKAIYFFVFFILCLTFDCGSFCRGSIFLFFLLAQITDGKGKTLEQYYGVKSYQTWLMTSRFRLYICIWFPLMYANCCFCLCFNWKTRFLFRWTNVKWSEESFVGRPQTS